MDSWRFNFCQISHSLHHILTEQLMQRLLTFKYGKITLRIFNLLTKLANFIS